MSKLSKKNKDFKNIRDFWNSFSKNKRIAFFAFSLLPLITLTQMFSPLLMKEAIDEGILKGNSQVLFRSALIFLFLLTTEYILYFFQNTSLSLAIHRTICSLRMKLIDHILKQSPSFHDNFLSGRLLTRATNDFDNLVDSLNKGVLGTIIDIAKLLGCILGMWSLNPYLTISIVLLLPSLAFMIRFFSVSIKNALFRVKKEHAKMNSILQESLWGSETIKTLTAQSSVLSTYSQINEKCRRHQTKSVLLDSALFAIIDGISFVTIGFVIWLSLENIEQFELITAGILIAFVQYIQQFFEPIKQFGSRIAMFQNSLTSLDRIFSLLRITPASSGKQLLPKSLQGNLVFRNVSFTYGNKNCHQILDQISFSVQSGQSLAVVGATGSGKSTLIKLLTKQYTNYTGDILIDNNNLMSLDRESYQTRIAYVPQDIVLFQGSIAFNITLQRTAVSEKDMIESAKLVGADSFIEKFPYKYQQTLKEGGKNLSQGERQLIVFARALATKSQFVFLDEATASIDSQSEKIIQDALDKLLRYHTTIIIAHRLSTIKRCHHILVMDMGKIIEEGSHEELYKKNGLYWQMIQTRAI